MFSFLPFQEDSDCLPNLGGRILPQYTRKHYYLPQRRRTYGTLHLSHSREPQYFHLFSNLCVYGDTEPNPGPQDCMDFVPGRDLQVINETAADHVTSCSKADHSCVTITMPPLYYRSTELLNHHVVYSSDTLKALRGCRIQLPQQVLSTVHHLRIRRHRGRRAGRRGGRRGLGSWRSISPCGSNYSTNIPVIITQRTDTSARVVGAHRRRIRLNLSQASMLAVDVQRDQPDRASVSPSSSPRHLSHLSSFLPYHFTRPS